ncbi:MAG: hypothetical protein HDT32_03875 [Clostridiales bacterium]|nr:hypothetical protein [Clostridiales bacterium]
MNNEKSRNKRITTALVSILVLAIVFSCVGILFNGSEVANAFQGNYTALKADDNTTTEMLLDGYADDTTGKGNVFNGEIFWKLVSKISGVTNPTAATLEGLGSTEKTSADFRTNNGGADVVVMIDGKPWTATYLSQNANGDPILTLWQADAISLNYYNVSTNAMATGVNIAWNPTNSTNSVNTYPSNSYGTSAMATAVLNNGGYFARSNTSATENIQQQVSSTYAKFTVPNTTPGMKGSLTDFIEIPNNTPYQKNNEKESAKKQALHSSYSYDANNDCLGAPITENMYQYTTANSPRIYYTCTTVNTDSYLAWGNDRLWLPSFAEVGYADTANGLWKTSTNQRSTSTTVSGNSVSYSWLRSAC